MSMDFTMIALAGLGATLAMDLTSHGLTLAGVFKAPVNPTVIGRWVGHNLKGTFAHASIAEAAPLRHEASLGTLAHYAIGIALALAYAAALSWLALESGLAVAIGFGVLTNALPWLWLFPSCGNGFFGLKGDGLLLSSFVNHAVFGAALFPFFQG